MFLQQIWFPLGGVMALSAALKKAGHQTKVTIGNEEKALREVIKHKPDMIFFPVITSFRKFMVDASKKIKRAGIDSLIVVGGYDASFFPETINTAPIDVLCIGEGDDASVELANAFDKGKSFKKIKNLWVRDRKTGKIAKNQLRPFKEVDDYLFYDRDIYRNYDSYFKDLEFEQVMAGRGCPYACSYCFNHQYRQLYSSVSKKYCDLRNPDKVIDECLFLKNKYKVKNIFFNDSTLSYNMPWLKEFLKKYKEKVNLPFSINATANEVGEEFFKLLAETGKCFIVRTAFETGNEKFRMGVLNKKITNEQYIHAINMFRKYKLKYSMSIMLGLPGETLENAFETLDFAVKLSGKHSVVAINIFKPFPKLDITEYGVKIGQYDKSLIEDTNMIGDNIMNVYNCLRQDDEGKRILILSRLAYIYLNFKFMRNIIKKKLIYYPDNVFYRLIWKFTEAFYTLRHHVNASWGCLIKCAFKHRGKQVRGA